MTQKNYSVRTADGRDTEEIKSIFRSARAFMAAHGNPQWQNGYPALGNIVSDLGRGYGHVLCCDADSGACGQRASVAEAVDGTHNVYAPAPRCLW